MIGTKTEGLSWRERAMTLEPSPTESRDAGSSPAVLDFKPSSVESAAWDPYEVWLTRVKQPRDARTRK